MPFDVSKALEDIARGDAGALEFIQTLYVFIQLQDDLVDRDKPVNFEQVAVVNLQLITVLARNEFLHEHRDQLLPVLTASVGAWIASEEWAKKENVLDRLTGQVLKSQYQDVMFQVALITGGMGHFLEMQRKYRDYAFDAVQTSA